MQLEWLNVCLRAKKTLTEECVREKKTKALVCASTSALWMLSACLP